MYKAGPKKGEEFLPSCAKTLKNVRKKVEKGKVPWEATGLYHSESPLNPGAYLAPADPQYPRFTGPAPSDARTLAPLTERPDTTWAATKLRDRLDPDLSHLYSFTELKREAAEAPDDAPPAKRSKSNTGAAAPSPGDDPSPSGDDDDDDDADDGLGYDNASDHPVEAEGDLSDDSDRPLSHTAVLKAMSALRTTDLVKLIGVHSERVGGFLDKLLTRAICEADVARLSAMEKTTQLRLTQLRV